MDIKEQQVLSAARGDDFSVAKLLGVGKNGMVVAAKCRARSAHTDEGKLYAVKLLFNFTQEYSSVMNNTYENEWLVLSRLSPHPHLVRYWTQFISPIPDQFLERMPSEIKDRSERRKQNGEVVRRRGQFIVLDYHPCNLEERLATSPAPLTAHAMISYARQLLEGVSYLQDHHICHLDLKLSNLLISDSGRLVLCDFGSAVQFPNSSFTMRWSPGMSVGGNRAHLSPEVLNAYHTCRRGGKQKADINYSKQSAFAAGVVIFEMAHCDHPLDDYPLGHTRDGMIMYDKDEIQLLSSDYPDRLREVAKQMVLYKPSTRLSTSSALTAVRELISDEGCDRERSKSLSHNSPFSTQELERAKYERDIAESRLETLAAERDFAMREMRTLASQCQTVATEFEELVQNYESLSKKLDEANHEKDKALESSEAAYELNHMLRDQLQLLMRERDLARDQVEELRELYTQLQADKEIRECQHCFTFYLVSDNKERSCQWHPGKYLFNRWSCCYKKDQKTKGCMISTHA